MVKNIETIGCFEVILDRYNGLTVSKASVPLNTKTFDHNLELLINRAISDEVNLLWLPLELEKSNLVPVATSFGFKYHTCHSDEILLVKEIKKGSIIPTASNHTLGVGVVVINEKNELLVVKERHSHVGFKLPGGHIDDGELIQSAVAREVKEETGIDVDFESVISLGHFYPHQFDKSNLYILCTAKPKSYEINISDTHEIIECAWVDVYEYINDENGFDYNKRIVKTALETKGMRSEDLESLQKIPKKYELFFSI